MLDSYEAQVKRLLGAGFPLSVLLGVSQTLLKKVKGGSQEPKVKPKQRPQVVPYMHKVSHNLKKVANRFNVPMVFSAPQKLAQLCPRVNQASSNKKSCTVKHVNKFVDCVVGVIYKIPSS